MIQTTLYFGRNITIGGQLNGTVSKASWEFFKIRSVDNRFNGYTELNGSGSWEGLSEKTFVLIIIWDDLSFSSEFSRKIQEIRREYCRDFYQDCVLRIDQKVEVIR